jgi:hypothetical protein
VILSRKTRDVGTVRHTAKGSTSGLKLDAV